MKMREEITDLQGSHPHPDSSKKKPTMSVGGPKLTLVDDGSVYAPDAHETGDGRGVAGAGAIRQQSGRVRPDLRYSVADYQVGQTIVDLANQDNSEFRSLYSVLLAALDATETGKKLPQPKF